MSRFFLALVLFISLSGAVSAACYVYALSGRSGQIAIIQVEKGSSVSTIASSLESAGLIRSALAFRLYVWRSGQAKELKAGTYRLDPASGVSVIVATIANGEAEIAQDDVKILPGWNIDEFSQAMTKQGLFADENLAVLAKRPLSEWSWSFAKPDFMVDAPAEATLEGYLFPDTYRLYKGAKFEDLLRKALLEEGFAKRVTPDMLTEARRRGHSLYEIVTMASVVEEEVRSDSDRRIVAGLFWKRIAEGKRLESCATLAYVTGENKKQYSYEDTRIESPYNTYMNAGLPPGPIANPSLSSIVAAIYPTESDYLYFLSRPDTGETVFAKTYDEHLANKVKYLD